jgi:hypothetical protein
MPYKKLSQLEFLNKKHRTICETLLFDIQRLESQLVYDDEMIEFLKSTVGVNTAEVSANYVSLNRRILTGLKLTFWYYTGADPGKVILDTIPDKDTIDIFNPI